MRVSKILASISSEILSGQVSIRNDNTNTAGEYLYDHILLKKI